VIRRFLVLQTLPRPLAFSPNNALLTLGHHLDRRRYEMSVAVPRDGLLSEAFEKEGIRVVRVPGLRTYHRHDAFWRLPLVGRRIAVQARRLGSQFLLSNHAELAPFARAAARQCGLPWICFLRQADRPARYYEKYRVAEADAVGAVSEAALRGYRDFLRSRGARENPSLAVPTGIELPTEEEGRDGAALPSAWPGDAPVAGIVGLREIKRPELFLEILSRVAGGVPEARGLLVGGLEENRRKWLESVARDCNVAERIWFAGEQRAMSPWYRTMRVYTHTSRSEGFPKTALEAMAHGLPVVAFRVGGLPEAVAHEETGFLCEPDDREGFARRVAELLVSPGRAAEMGRAGRRRVRKLFSPAAMVAGMEALFEGVLDRRETGKDGAATRGRRPSSASR
jgi:glycosyltransferase involved in cell wall biosynthesis